MVVSRAEIQTEDPRRLMRRLCKHWARKFPVGLGEDKGEIELPLGVCRLHSAHALTVELESDAEQMPRLQEVVADHLQRMEGKQPLVVEWR